MSIFISMKLLELYLESINIPFKNKCKITIKNIKGKKIIVDCEIPTTEEEKMQGLMYRENLCDNCGMFFEKVEGGFWMKNVNFPLEMIFIKNNKIVDIKNALPNDETIIVPSVDSDSNLEVKNGFCESNNISIGDEVYKS